MSSVCSQSFISTSDFNENSPLDINAAVKQTSTEGQCTDNAVTMSSQTLSNESHENALDDWTLAGASSLPGVKQLSLKYTPAVCKSRHLRDRLRANFWSKTKIQPSMNHAGKLYR